jgi:hypothetical protein
VRFVFSANDHLFATVADLSLCDQQKSIDKYIRLCEDKIRQTYPNVGDNVDVINSDEDFNAGDTYVEVWDGREKILSLIEREVVNEICERIFEQRNWYEWKTSVSIAEAQMNVQLPPSIIRWVCAKEGVTTNKSTTYWRILTDELDRIHQQIELIRSLEHLKESTHGTMPIACYLEDMKDTLMKAFPEDIDLQIVSKGGFDEELFASDTSLFHLKRKGNRVDVLVEHFINVVEWSLWDCNYPKAVTTLQQQAARKGIDCQLQLPDGISFLRSIEMSRDLSLQQCIEEFLQPFPEVIGNVKFWNFVINWGKMSSCYDKSGSLQENAMAEI